MLVNFKTQDSVITISSGNKTNTVLLTIDKLGQEIFTVYLPPTLGRSIASCLMGASAEAAQKKGGND